jgi:hypothetical protein
VVLLCGEERVDNALGLLAAVPPMMRNRRTVIKCACVVFIMLRR